MNTLYIIGFAACLFSGLIGFITGINVEMKRGGTELDAERCRNSASEIRLYYETDKVREKAKRALNELKDI